VIAALSVTEALMKAVVAGPINISRPTTAAANRHDWMDVTAPQSLALIGYKALPVSNSCGDPDSHACSPTT
jgi:hypothetical protein